MEKLEGVDSISPPDQGDRKEYIGLAAVYPRAFRSVPFEPTALLDRTQLRDKRQSCVRLCWSTPQEIYDKVVAKSKPMIDCRQLIAGMLIATVHEIGEVLTETGEGAIQVIISGQPDYRAHVDIGTTDSADECISDKDRKDTIRTIRQKLLDKFISSSCPDNPEKVSVWPQLTTASSWIKTKNSSHCLPVFGDIV